MNKAVGAILCIILVASPLLLLFSADIQEEGQVPWQLHYRGVLDYARRQPQRLLQLTGLKSKSLDKVLEDTSAKVSAIPEATVHSAGAALVFLRHAFVEGLRKFLQGAEAAYLAGNDLATKLGSHSWLSQQHSKWHALWAPKSWTDSARHWGNKGTGLIKDGWEWVGPGGRLHPEEFLERFYGHIIIEGLLAIIIGYLFFQSSFKSSSKSPKPLTEEEIDDLCIEWQPEPLHTTLPARKLPFKDVVVTSATGKLIEIQGVSGKVLNMVSFDFLGCAGDHRILEDCKATVAKYGVGACGPRGFYGTIDVHLNVEEALAKFMGTAECIIYAYDLSTVPSVLPAFANARDLIIVDEAADYPIQNGCALSRAKIAKFKHNDMADLERVIQGEMEAHSKLRKPLNRRFIIVEGIYKATGDMAPLREIYELKEKYKFRLIVDESLSFGVLGERGRGACEHFGLKPSDVEIVCASMGNALASVGGFCVGDREIIDHQRLSGLGYCFSAALPPYLATAAIGSLAILDSERGKGLLQKLNQNAKLMRSALADIEEAKVVGGTDSLSPVIHLQLSGNNQADQEEDAQVLQEIADRALKDSHILFTVHKKSALDKVQQPSSLRLTVTAEHGDEDIRAAISALNSAIKKSLRH